MCLCEIILKHDTNSYAESLHIIFQVYLNIFLSAISVTYCYAKVITCEVPTGASVIVIIANSCKILKIFQDEQTAVMSKLVLLEIIWI